MLTDVPMPQAAIAEAEELLKLYDCASPSAMSSASDSDDEPSPHPVSATTSNVRARYLATPPRGAKMAQGQRVALDHAGGASVRSTCSPLVIRG